MNPEFVPQLNLEHNERVSGGNEQISGLNQERLETSHEREQNMQQVDRENKQPLPPTTNVTLPLAPVALPVVQQAVDDTVGPTVANDDDLIEKEWVDQAKKIIAETQNDPYMREQAVNKLQIDYLRKRYGKELGVSD
ncbi:MAG: hypothetical protein WAW80_00695 [Candidatus Saccharimonadales bacterium]